jgi:hypothetical protein
MNSLGLATSHRSTVSDADTDSRSVEKAAMERAGVSSTNAVNRLGAIGGTRFDDG